MTCTEITKLITKKAISMRKTITLLVTLLAMFFSMGIYAADYDVKSTQYPNDSYATDDINLNLSEVAEALGTDTATLANAISTTSTGAISIVAGDSTSNAYTTNLMGFWLNSDGGPVKWGSSNGSVWYVDFTASTATNALMVSIGQYPGVHDGTKDFNYTAHFTLTYGEKSTSIDVSLLVKAYPNLLSTNKVADLTIVDGGEYIYEQEIRNTAVGDDKAIYVGDITKALGFTDDEKSAVHYGVYARGENTETGLAADTITRTYTHDTTPGWWFKSLVDETTGDDSEECVSAAESNETKFYINSLQTDGDSLRFTIGQYSSATLKAGDTSYTYLYLGKGTTVYRIKIGLKFSAAVEYTTDMLTKAGELNIEKSFALDETAATRAADGFLATNTKSRVSIDINSILASFPEGASISDLQFATYYKADTHVLDFWDNAATSHGYTASSNGIYMNYKTGESHSYTGSNEVKLCFDKTNFTYLEYAYNNISANADTTCTYECFFVYKNSQYYQFNVKINYFVTTEITYKEVEADRISYYLDNSITLYTYDGTEFHEAAASEVVTDGSVTYYVDSKEYVEPEPTYTVETCVQVAEKDIDVTLSYHCGSSRTLSRYVDDDNSSSGDNKHNVVTDLNADSVNSLIGTTTPQFYVETKGTDAAGNDSIYFTEANAGFSNTEFSSNEGGSWLTKEGYTGSYGTSAPWGFSHHNCQIEWWKYGPDQFTDNEVSKTKIWVVNLVTGKRIQYNVTATWVRSIVKVADVGSQELVLAARGADGVSSDEVEFDIKPIADSLGLSVDEFNELAEWRAANATGAITKDNFIEPDGFAFMENGRTTDSGEEVFYAGYDSDAGTFNSYVIDDANIENNYTATIYVYYELKRYTLNIVVTKDPDAYKEATGINAIAGNKTVDNDAIYDLSGRIVKNPAKGIYIKNGKKYMVK